MSESDSKSVKQGHEEDEFGTRAEVKRLAGLMAFIVLVTALALLFFVAAVNPQQKYSLISPGGIAFSDFRGYEDWPVASSARQDDILKVIVANPKMIAAYKSGVPGNGQPFPRGLHDREAPVEAEEEHGSPIRCGCAGLFHPGFRHGKGQQEVPEYRWLGIRGVQLRCRVGRVHR